MFREDDFIDSLERDDRFLLLSVLRIFPVVFMVMQGLVLFSFTDNESNLFIKVYYLLTEKDVVWSSVVIEILDWFICLGIIIHYIINIPGGTFSRQEYYIRSLRRKLVTLSFVIEMIGIKLVLLYPQRDSYILSVILSSLSMIISLVSMVIILISLVLESGKVDKSING